MNDFVCMRKKKSNMDHLENVHNIALKTRIWKKTDEWIIGLKEFKYQV